MLCAVANNAVGSTVPASTSAITASSAAELAGLPGVASVIRATGRTASPAAASWSAVTATGSRPRSSLACDTVNAAEISWAATTSPSPPSVEPDPCRPAMTVTPASDNAKPTQAMGRAQLCPSIAAMIATRTGVAPISRAACVTLVRCTPKFWSRTEPPYPAAPEITTAGLQAPRSRDLLTSMSTAAASPNRTKVSQAGASQPSASFDSGTVVPHRTPAVTRAGKTRRRLVFMSSVSPVTAVRFGLRASWTR